MRLKVIAAMQLTKQFIEGDGESVREAVEAKASAQTAISFTGSYMSKCSVSSKRGMEARSSYGCNGGASSYAGATAFSGRLSCFQGLQRFEVLSRGC